ncbi:GDSL esterase/lipase At1g28670-like [Nicotiana sylvestris]|uniref:GDSL esterase/lipase At1g28670-like n=1 Tax=Nicotiana sylvestris TaxID=4096 RepID=UPI00388C890B
MALTIRVVDLFVLSLIIFLVIQEYSQKIDAQVLMLQAPLLIKRKFDKIYQFRESLSDTGNFIRESLIGAQSIYARLPYGMDFPGGPSGRCSNGILMIDFIEISHVGISSRSYTTALPAEVMAENKIVDWGTNSSLNVQLDRMSSHSKPPSPLAINYYFVKHFKEINSK